VDPNNFVEEESSCLSLTKGRSGGSGGSYLSGVDSVLWQLVEVILRSVTWIILSPQDAFLSPSCHGGGDDKEEAAAQSSYKLKPSSNAILRSSCRSVGERGSAENCKGGGEGRNI
jgi:hypothetical protein